MHNFKNLIKYYFIDKFNSAHLVKLDKSISLIWRSKHNSKDQIIKISSFCRKNNRKLFIANDFKQAIKFNLKGVYISASNKDLTFIKKFFPNKFKVIGSAHNLKELRIKKIQNVDEIFFSPIFKTKKNKELGIYRVKYLLDSFKKNKIALGGINSSNIKLLKLSKFAGFAGIKYFE